MAQDNSIPLLGFQGESPVDNFLSSYSKSQQQAQGNELHQRKIGMLDMQSEQDKLAMVADALVNVADGDAAGFERVKQGLVARKIIDPQTAAQYDVSALPQIKAASEKWRAMQKFNMDRERHNVDLQSVRANIAQSYAAADASRRSGRGVGGLGGGGTPGGKAPPEWAAKDMMFLKRGIEANNGFTPEATKALTQSARDWMARGLGEYNTGLGNIAQSKESRQASQVAKNFVAIVLRKDTGAAVTPQEFDFYKDIFIPQYGDDDGTLQLKATARNTFLAALGSGLSHYQALQSMNITPPEGLMPSEGQTEAPQVGGAAAPAAAGAATTIIDYDANGNRVSR